MTRIALLTAAALVLRVFSGDAPTRSLAHITLRPVMAYAGSSRPPATDRKTLAALHASPSLQLAPRTAIDAARSPLKSP